MANKPKSYGVTSSTSEVAHIGSRGSLTSTTIVSGAPTSTRGLTGVIVRKPETRDVRGAIYAHLQAVRALGRTTTDSAEIADALGLPQGEVERALRTLGEKGVRIKR